MTPACRLHRLHDMLRLTSVRLETFGDNSSYLDVITRTRTRTGAGGHCARMYPRAWLSTHPQRLVDVGQGESGDGSNAAAQLRPGSDEPRRLATAPESVKRLRAVTTRQVARAGILKQLREAW